MSNHEIVQEPDFTKGKSWRFWAIFPSLMVTTLLSAMEVTVVSTSLATIVHDLDIGKNYVWIVNSFVLSSTAFIPIIGQLADAWGRRWPMLVSVALFTVGSGIAGGANSGDVLIVGRAIQGLGCGGLNMLVDLILCDLVPLKERGKFIGLINAVFAIGLFVGPFIGGIIVQRSSWRWVFWLNLPIAGVSLILLFAFLQVNYVKAPLRERIKQIDYLGNFLIVGSSTSLLYSLTYAGVSYPWSDPRTLVPLIIGVAGVGVFHLWEASRFCTYPTMPARLFNNRTTNIAFFISFVHALMILWELYFLPVYFQAVQLVTPTRSGVHILPTMLGMLPGALLAGQYLSRFGKYKLLHVFGMVFMTVGMGSFVALDASSSTAMWVCFQLIAVLGNGTLATSLLPAVQAGLTDEDNAASTATWSYIRSYGALWGVTVPATIFNNIFTKHLSGISDPSARVILGDGNAYAYAARDFVLSFPPDVQEDIVRVYTDTLKIIWAVAAAICGFSGIFTLLEKDIPLRSSLRAEFGVKEPKKEAHEEAQN
ncbi:major facilitator superfamily domain-containing protein [Xylariales sp. PMI_506]|nr:major facilitator superfamily domain-containing protein [Xylariales sp. PMI_506]